MSAFQKAVADATTQIDAGKRYNALTSIIRSVLQHAAIASVELAERRLPMEDVPDLADIAGRLLQPSDGVLVETLDNLLPILDSQLFEGLARLWFDASAGASLSVRTRKWVEDRNSRVGHGVVDEKTYVSGNAEMESLVPSLLAGLTHLLPSAGGGLTLQLPDGQPYAMLCLCMHSGGPVVYRRITKRASSWQLQFQPLNFADAPNEWHELSQAASIPKLLESSSSGYISRTVGIGESAWRPTVLTPLRQTDTFHARQNELSALDDWFNDSDSRACLVFGQGGIGKTTLVLEYINLLLEDYRPTCSWRPELISYFSAKQTRWSDSGLIHLRGVEPAVADALRTLVRAVEDTSQKSWHTPTTEGLIDKTAGLLASAGLKRTDVLLILDNTETLTRSTTEETEFGRLLSRISQRVCRLLMTSRRREQVEAKPIHVLGLAEADAATLLRRLGRDYQAKSIIDASDSQLNSIAKELHGRPILLEVLAKHASRGGRTLKKALEAVLSQASQDLGNFLFDDAWQRLSPEQRSVFLVLAKLGGTLDGTALGWICQSFHVPYSLWMEGFEETRFGTVASYGPKEDIQLNPETLVFMEGKLLSGRPELVAVEQVAADVIRRRVALLAANNSSVRDRVIEAFRTEAARAAKKAVDRGNYKEAVEWFEEATKADAQNSALWDRYAYFLMTKGHDLDRAAQVAAEAVRLDPSDGDASFTGGMIAARQARITEADALLSRAAANGKKSHLVAAQKARARVYLLKKPKAMSFEKQRQALEEARVHVKEAREKCENSGRLALKHLEECARIESDMARIASRLGVTLA